MSTSEIKKIRQAIKETHARVKEDSAYSKELLAKSGIYKADGTLAKRYSSYICTK